MGWEFGPGESKPWQLVVSPGGVRSLLPLTVAWVEAAPDDEAVEFLPAKPPRPDAVDAELQLPHGQQIDLGSLQFAATATTQAGVADVVVYHPAFVSLPEDDGYEIIFLALDAVLGEFAVMTSLAAIWPVTEPQPGMVPLAQLQATLRDRSA